MKVGANIGFLLLGFVGILREEFSTAPTDDPEGNAGLGDLPSLPVELVACSCGSHRWMACLLLPPTSTRDFWLMMRVWVLDNDGLTPHVVGVIMSRSRLQPRTLMTRGSRVSL